MVPLLEVCDRPGLQTFVFIGTFVSFGTFVFFETFVFSVTALTHLMFPSFEMDMVGHRCFSLATRSGQGLPLAVAL